jgi:hypothetical protein
MAEFVAFDSRVESKGAAILATLKGLPFDIEPVLSAHGLSPLDPDGWYPQQSWLDALRAISQLPGVSSLELVSIGMKIPETADWPPNVTTLDEALFSIDVAYHLNHRGGEIGYYKAERIDDQTIRVTCHNPFPSDLDYGIVYGVARMFRLQGKEFFVDRADSPSRKKGDDRCVYFVHLE